ncbi:MAG: c-type cytochrome [Mariprofundaceae bacterium]
MRKSLISALLLLLISACGQGSDDASPVGSTGLSDVVGGAISSIKRESQQGAALTRKKCGSCHYLDRNIRKVGPTLKGVYGRKPSISGIPFELWDEASLHAWMEDPKQVKPKTKMAIPGMKDAGERQAIIDYLKQL